MEKITVTFEIPTLLMPGFNSLDKEITLRVDTDLKEALLVNCLTAYISQRSADSLIMEDWIITE